MDDPTILDTPNDPDEDGTGEVPDESDAGSDNPPTDDEDPD